MRGVLSWLTGSIWIIFLICFDVSTSKAYNMNTSPTLDDGCALRLNRSSSPTMPYSKSHMRLVNRQSDVCIRYDDVNKALKKAKAKLHYRKPPPMMLGVDPSEIDKSANLIIETTKILAKKFHLSFREINEDLPSIDTSKTDIWDVCPAIFKPRPCTISRFRSLDGHCNNIKHSVWGTSNTPFIRFLPPKYSNGIDAPRVSSVDGGPLPNVRRVSATVHRDFNRPSEQRAIYIMSWGQFMDHDLTLAAPTRDKNDLETTCCKFPPRKRHKNCMPIDVPSDDPFYSDYGVRCLDFTRNLAGHRPGCALGPRVNINQVTNAMDASIIYGSSDERALKLRLGTGDMKAASQTINISELTDATELLSHILVETMCRPDFSGGSVGLSLCFPASKGLMRTWEIFKNEGLKGLLPPMTDNPEKDCVGRPRHLFCFLAGDDRANEQIHLTVQHTLYLRQHNRIAKRLAYLNPHWDDERLYQEARHIMAATIQHIAFNEFLPRILGPEYFRKYNLTLQKEGYWYGYDDNVNRGPAKSFQAAAMRFGHSLIQGLVRQYDKYHKFIGSIELREFLRKPFILYQPGIIDKLIGGLINTPAQLFDPFITQEVTNHLFQEPMNHFGRDLVSLNLMRGREHGIPGYNDFREFCGMSRIQTFEELEFYMSNGTAVKYSMLYKHPDDIDLWSAGVSERVMESAMVGPTFACIIANQFSLVRKGDRFWYENPGFPSSFTPAQLQEIRKIHEAKLVCDNADDIPTIQMFALQLPHPIYNPRVNCSDLPTMNLEYWREDPSSGKFRYANQ